MFAEPCSPRLRMVSCLIRREQYFRSPRPTAAAGGPHHAQFRRRAQRRRPTTGAQRRGPKHQVSSKEG
jgi:hypothetical protein